MAGAMCSYGIRVGPQEFCWMIRRGDLVTPSNKKITEKSFHHTCYPGDRRTLDMSIYGYTDGGEDDVPLSWRDGEHGKLDFRQGRHSLIIHRG